MFKVLAEAGINEPSGRRLIRKALDEACRPNASVRMSPSQISDFVAHWRLALASWELRSEMVNLTKEYPVSKARVKSRL
jgi:hypothetical protein